jgi:hypothetical protein
LYILGSSYIDTSIYREVGERCINILDLEFYFEDGTVKVIDLSYKRLLRGFNHKGTRPVICILHKDVGKCQDATILRHLFGAVTYTMNPHQQVYFISDGENIVDIPLSLHDVYGFFGIN